MTPLQQHYPHPTRPSNPSLLELAIYNFELKAKKFHDEKLKVDCNDKGKLAQMTRDYDHLQCEKRRIVTHVALQKGLSDYRNTSENASINTLLAEQHHPTDALGKYLTAIGEPKPTKMHEAHHIICGKGKYLQPVMLTARLNLHLHGVGINDPINGVWLVNFLKNKEQDWATPEAPAHRNLHRHNYESWIVGNLSAQNLSKPLFLTRLKTIKIKIRTGDLPPQVLGPKNELWKGL